MAVNVAILDLPGNPLGNVLGTCVILILVEGSWMANPIYCNLSLFWGAFGWQIQVRKLLADAEFQLKMIISTITVTNGFWAKQPKYKPCKTSVWV